MTDDSTTFPELNPNDPRNIFVAKYLETGNVVESYLAAYPDKKDSPFLQINATLKFEEQYVIDLIERINSINIKALVPKPTLIATLYREIEKGKNSRNPNKTTVEAVQLLAKISGIDKPVEKENDGVVYVFGNVYENESHWEKEAIEATKREN